MNEENDKQGLGNGSEEATEFPKGNGGETGGEKPKEKNQNKNPQNQNKSGSKVSLRSKKMNAHQFAEMIGMNRGSKLWVSKTYKKSDIRSAKKWSDEFILKGALSSEPEILSKNA